MERSSSPTWSVYEENGTDETIAEGTPALPAVSLGGCRPLSQYRKQGVVQRGAQGVIYRATNRTTGAVVAIKRLFSDFTSHRARGVSETIVREATYMQSLRHPNVLHAIEVTLGPQHEVCIVCPYCPLSLSACAIRRTTPFPIPQMKYVLQGLLSALEHVHSKDLMHRDVKPSNVLFGSEGDVLLGDFGSARCARNHAPLTPASNRITLLYRPPEVLLGASYGPSVDMWAAGVCFAEMLQQSYLFRCNTEISMIGKVWELIGTPTADSWPSFTDLPACSSFTFVAVQPSLQKRFSARTTAAGVQLLQWLLEGDPSKRPTAQQALQHPYFREAPLPCTREEFARFVADEVAIRNGPKQALKMAALDEEDEEGEE